MFYDVVYIYIVNYIDMRTTRLNERDLTRIVRRMINEGVIVPLDKGILSTLKPGTGTCTVETYNDGKTPYINIKINGWTYSIGPEELRF